MKRLVPLAALATGLFSGALAQEPAALKLFKTIPLPGVKGRFDHFALDAKGHRLFVAALGNNTLEVLDVAAGKHLKSITGLHKPTGVVFLPELNQIGVANGDDGTFKLFDGVSYELANNLLGLDDADNVRRDTKTQLIYVGLFYDAKRKCIYTSCGEGFIDIIRQTDREHYETIAKIPTRAGARTSFFSSELNRFFLALPERGIQPAELRVFEVQE